MAAADRDEALGLGGRLEDAPAVRVRDDVVFGRVEDELGYRDTADLRDRLVPLAGEEAHRQPRVGLLPYVRQRGIRRLEHQRRGGQAGGELGGDAGAERVAEEHDALGGHSQRLGHVAVGGLRVEVDPLLVRPAFAPAESAVVVREEVDPDVARVRVELGSLAVADIAVVSVVDQQPPAAGIGGGGSGGNDPGVEADAVGGEKLDGAMAQGKGRGGVGHLAVAGDVDEGPLARLQHDDRADVDDDDQDQGGDRKLAHGREYTPG